MALLPSEYDSEFDQAASDVAAYESAYFSANGRYRQLLSLGDAGLSEPADIDVAVDVYQSTSGFGYVVRASATVDTVTYERTLNVGPDTDRTRGWTALGPGTI